MMQCIVGFVAAAIIGFAAWKARSLTRSGAVAAMVIGTAVFGAGGIKAAILLLSFFVSGSLLSKLPGAKLKDDLTGRDWKQVMANGFVPALAILLAVLFPLHERIYTMMFYGSLSTAASDTFATEIGTRYGGTPRDLLTGRKLTSGLSGGVTLAGIAASAIGALLIALLAGLNLPGLRSSPGPSLWLPVTLSGIFAGLFDSLFGSALQAKYWCEQCGEIVENKHHSHEIQLLRGWKWMTNSMVNFITVLIGALIAAFWP